LHQELLDQEDLAEAVTEVVHLQVNLELVQMDLLILVVAVVEQEQIQELVVLVDQGW
jgi:hypothetical protein